MSIESIGTELASAISNISGLTVYSPTQLRDAIEPPCAMVIAGEIGYHPTMSGDGVADLTYRVLLAIMKGDSPAALSQLMPYLEMTGNYSVKAKVEADRTLNASAADCKVEKSTGQGIVTWNGTTYIGSEFTVSVWQ